MENETKYAPKFNSAKFKELMLYAARKSSNDEYFGAIKLNKILFFSDFLAYGLTGEAITGATYQRREKGPAPKQLLAMAREIKAKAEGVFVERKIFNHTQRRLVPLREPNLHHFSPEEIDLVDDVIRDLFPYTASQVSDLSHERSFAWQIASVGEDIPYPSVFLSSRKATNGDIQRGLELARKYGWLEYAS